MTRDFVGETVKEFEDLHKEAQSIFSVLDDAYTELKSIQQQARRVTAEAREKGFSVTGREDGTVVIADALICEVDGPGQRKREMMQWPERGRPVRAVPRSGWDPALVAGVALLTGLVAGCSGTTGNATPATDRSSGQASHWVDGATVESVAGR